MTPNVDVKLIYVSLRILPDHPLIQDNRVGYHHNGLGNPTKKHGNQEKYFTHNLWSQDGKCSHLSKEGQRFLLKHVLTLPRHLNGSWKVVTDNTTIIWSHTLSQAVVKSGLHCVTVNLPGVVQGVAFGQHKGGLWWRTLGTNVVNHFKPEDRM